MRKIWALIRATAISAASYRTAFLTGLLSSLVTALPIFFITKALQPTMAASIAGEGSNYFGFVILGLMLSQWMSFGSSSAEDALLGSIRNGTLEAFFATPTRLPTLMAGLMGWPFLMTLLRSVVMVGTAMLFGVKMHLAGVPLALLVILLVAVAYSGVSLLSAALVLTIRTSGPLISAVSVGSYLLGGVYYSTSSIPSWIRSLSEIVPLAPGLRALRRVLLEGSGWTAVSGDVGHLALLAFALLAVTTPFLLLALHQARRTGTLAQY